MGRTPVEQNIPDMRNAEMSLPLNLAPQHLDRRKKKASCHNYILCAKNLWSESGKMAVMCYKCKANLNGHIPKYL